MATQDHDGSEYVHGQRISDPDLFRRQSARYLRLFADLFESAGDIGPEASAGFLEAITQAARALEAPVLSGGRVRR